MALITKLSRLQNGIERQVDLSTNTLVLGGMQLNGSTSGTFTQTANPVTTDYSIVWPAAQAASAGYVLSNDGSGNLTWVSAAAGSALDGTFRIDNTADPTKQIAFDASGITTGTTRTLKMSDFDTDLAALVNANISATAAIALTKLAALSNHNRALVSDASGFIAESAVTSTELGYVSGVTSAIQTQINNITSSIQNFEWQPSVLSATVLTPPGSPSVGDRYLIDGVGTGAWATHDNSIAQWSGSAWVFTVPTTGTFVASDAEPNLLYLFGGSSWTQKYFESTTASTGLTKVGFDIQLANATGTGVTVTSGAFAVLFDNSTIGLTTNQLYVKDAGITLAKLASNSVDENKIVSTTYSASGAITGGSGTKVAVAVDGSSIEISTNALRIKSTAYDQATITGGSGSSASVISSPSVKKTIVSDTSMAANTTFAVRLAVSGETAGRYTKADQNASSSDLFYVTGLALSTSAVSAGQNTTMTMMGTHILGSSDTNFSAGDIGKPVFLTASGAFSVTAPTTANYAVVRIGIVEQVDRILVMPVVVGVN